MEDKQRLISSLFRLRANSMGGALDWTAKRQLHLPIERIKCIEWFDLKRSIHAERSQAETEFQTRTCSCRPLAPLVTRRNRDRLHIIGDAGSIRPHGSCSTSFGSRSGWKIQYSTNTHARNAFGPKTMCVCLANFGLNHLNFRSPNQK